MEERLLNKKKRALKEGNEKLLAEALRDLGAYYDDNARYIDAIQQYQQLCQLYSGGMETDLRMKWAASQRMIGEMYLSMGDFDEALQYLHKYLTVAQELDYIMDEIKAQENLGRLYLVLGQSKCNEEEARTAWLAAEKALMESLRLTVSPSLVNTKDDELLDTQARILLNTADVQERLGNFDKAIGFLKKAKKICSYKHFYEVLHNCYTTEATLYCNQKKFHEALVCLDAALELVSKIKNRNNRRIKDTKLCEVLAVKADVLCKMSEYRDAKKILKRAWKKNTPDAEDKQHIECCLKVVTAMCNTLDLLDSTSPLDHKTKKKLYEKLGDGACRIKNYAGAAEYYVKMLQHAQLAGDSGETLAPIYVSLYQTHKDMGNYLTALDYCRLEYEQIKHLPTEAFITQYNISEFLYLAKCFPAVENACLKAWEAAKKANNKVFEIMALKMLLKHLKRYAANRNMESVKNELRRLGYQDFNNLENTEEELRAVAGGDQDTTYVGDDVDLEDLRDESDTDDEMSAEKLVDTTIRKNSNGETSPHHASRNGKIQREDALLVGVHPVNEVDDASGSVRPGPDNAGGGENNDVSSSTSSPYDETARDEPFSNTSNVNTPVRDEPLLRTSELKSPGRDTSHSVISNINSPVRYEPGPNTSGTNSSTTDEPLPSTSNATSPITKVNDDSPRPNKISDAIKNAELPSTSEIRSIFRDKPRQISTLDNEESDDDVIFVSSTSPVAVSKNYNDLAIEKHRQELLGTLGFMNTYIKIENDDNDKNKNRRKKRKLNNLQADGAKKLSLKGHKSKNNNNETQPLAENNKKVKKHKSWKRIMSSDDSDVNENSYTTCCENVNPERIREESPENTRRLMTDSSHVNTESIDTNKKTQQFNTNVAIKESIATTSKQINDNLLESKDGSENNISKSKPKSKKTGKYAPLIFEDDIDSNELPPVDVKYCKPRVSDEMSNDSGVNEHNNSKRRKLNDLWPDAANLSSDIQSRTNNEYQTTELLQNTNQNPRPIKSQTAVKSKTNEDISANPIDSDDRENNETMYVTAVEETQRLDIVYSPIPTQTPPPPTLKVHVGNEVLLIALTEDIINRSTISWLVEEVKSRLNGACPGFSLMTEDGMNLSGDKPLSLVLSSPELKVFVANLKTETQSLTSCAQELHNSITYEIPPREDPSSPPPEYDKRIPSPPLIHEEDTVLLQPLDNDETVAPSLGHDETSPRQDDKTITPPLESETRTSPHLEQKSSDWPQLIELHKIKTDIWTASSSSSSLNQESYITRLKEDSPTFTQSPALLEESLLKNLLIPMKSRSQESSRSKKNKSSHSKKTKSSHLKQDKSSHSRKGSSHPIQDTSRTKQNKSSQSKHDKSDKSRMSFSSNTHNESPPTTSSHQQKESQQSSLHLGLDGSAQFKDEISELPPTRKHEKSRSSHNSMRKSTHHQKDSLQHRDHNESSKVSSSRKQGKPSHSRHNSTRSASSYCADNDESAQPTSPKETLLCVSAYFTPHNSPQNDSKISSRKHDKPSRSRHDSSRKSTSSQSSMNDVIAQKSSSPHHQNKLPKHFPPDEPPQISAHCKHDESLHSNYHHDKRSGPINCLLTMKESSKHSSRPRHHKTWNRHDKSRRSTDSRDHNRDESSHNSSQRHDHSVSSQITEPRFGNDNSTQLCSSHRHEDDGMSQKTLSRTVNNESSENTSQLTKHCESSQNTPTLTMHDESLENTICLKPKSPLSIILKRQGSDSWKSIVERSKEKKSSKHSSRFNNKLSQPSTLRSKHDRVRKYCSSQSFKPKKFRKRVVLPQTSSPNIEQTESRSSTKVELPHKNCPLPTSHIEVMTLAQPNIEKDMSFSLPTSNVLSPATTSVDGLSPATASVDGVSPATASVDGVSPNVPRPEVNVEPISPHHGDGVLPTSPDTRHYESHTSLQPGLCESSQTNWPLRGPSQSPLHSHETPRHPSVVLPTFSSVKTDPTLLYNNKPGTSLPSQPKVPTFVLPIKMECPDEPQLDDDVLAMLGDLQTENPLGAPLHSQVALRWQQILSNGLQKEVKDEIMSNYLVPYNCQLLQAPSLNPEVKTVVRDSLTFLDSKLMNQQKQLGSALSALGSAVNSIFANKSPNSSTILKPILDACRLLCDMHHHETDTRRDYIMNSLSSDLKESLVNTVRGSQLFGDNVRYMKTEPRYDLNYSDLTNEPSTSTGDANLNPPHEGGQ